MELTRRGRFFAALAVALAGVAVLLADPRPLVGTAGLGAALLSAQLEASARFRAAHEALSVTVTPGVAHTRVGRAEPVVLSATRPAAGPAIAATMRLPVGVDGPDRAGRTVRLDPGEAAIERTIEARFDTAGTFQFPDATVSFRDRLGFFTETVPVDVDASVRVEPEVVSELHVGRGGEGVPAAYGEHSSDRTGPGLVPEELRTYVAGDPAQWIDWKSTARLAEPHVREFEVETDRRTTLLIDTRVAAGGATHGRSTAGRSTAGRSTAGRSTAGRSTAGRSTAGRSTDVTAYLREGALAIAGLARANADPLGLWIVDDGGYTRVETAARSPDGYARIREAIFDLSPSAGVGAVSRPSLRQPTAATRTTRRLSGDDSAFARTVSAFTASAEAYVSHVVGDPLFEAARDLSARNTDGLTVVVTDDTRRDRLRETLPLVTRGNNRALVLCFPRVLFEPSGLADLESAYDRYLSFESFRRDLERLPRVTALEAGPGDRIDAILATRRDGDSR